MDSKYVVVIGSMNCDLIFMQERLPCKGETLQTDSLSILSGGKGANQAVQISKLGMKTYMVAKVGKDAFGEYLKNEIEGFEVDTEFVKDCEAVTGIAAVNSLEDGGYYSSVAPGANFELTCEDIEMVRNIIAGAAAVVLQLEIPVNVTEYAIKVASLYGVYIVLNAAPAKPLSTEILKLVDCIVVNENEASYYLGKHIDSVEKAQKYGGQLLEKVKSTVIITLGDKGSMLLNNNGITVYNTDSTIEAVETTGSGDSYVGAFAFLKANGANDEEACEFASAASQFTVTKVGAQCSMPSLKYMKSMLDNICLIN